MQVGGGGSLRSDINVTPLVDVVLVLLIIFMVITPVVPKAPANLPPSAIQDQIVLRLMPGARIFINKDEIPAEQFPARIREVLHGNTSKMIFFQGSPENDYETTMTFLDTARANGAQNIGIIVEAAQ